MEIGGPLTSVVGRLLTTFVCGTFTYKADATQLFAAPKAVAFQVTLKEAEGVSPFKPIENKEAVSESKIRQKLEMAEERRLVGFLLVTRCAQIKFSLANLKY